MFYFLLSFVSAIKHKEYVRKRKREDESQWPRQNRSDQKVALSWIITSLIRHLINKKGWLEHICRKIIRWNLFRRWEKDERIETKGWFSSMCFGWLGACTHKKTLMHLVWAHLFYHWIRCYFTWRRLSKESLSSMRGTTEKENYVLEV